MSNKTFIPAFQCNVGDWKYYICTMKYGEVARQVQFAFELGKNDELGQLIQRGITSRTKEITDYILTSEHRFLGGLVIAAWGGEPTYTPLSIDDPDGFLKGLDRGFGVLTFDGTQAYFVLDGQHRLKAIKDACRKNPDIGKEDICVLIVTHYDTTDGRVRTRRLFSNINRNAKQTAIAENIALDEDDALAILTRRLLEEHLFLSEPRRVRVILSTTDDGEVKLAPGSVPQSDPKALTTFTVLYDLLKSLAYDQPKEIQDRAHRPDDDLLEAAYSVFVQRLDDLFKHCGDIQTKLEAATNAKDIRAPRNQEANGHPFMRPVVQKAVARAVSEIVTEELLTWPEVMTRLEALEWSMGAAPWIAVFSPDSGKMLTGKDNTELLVRLLRVHLAPESKSDIQRARKSYKDIRGGMYPISEEDLTKNLVTGGKPEM
ncbi:DNA sulfur modification protein DndB [Armatimonas rosea]|nr:DNA sulfur modification protein DndB [Armatimonas rosea]